MVLDEELQRITVEFVHVQNVTRYVSRHSSYRPTLENWRLLASTTSNKSNKLIKQKQKKRWTEKNTQKAAGKWAKSLRFNKPCIGA